MLEERRQKTPVERMIEYLVVAGGLRAMAGDQPDSARGLIKQANFYSAKAATIAAELAVQGAPG